MLVMWSSECTQAGTLQQHNRSMQNVCARHASVADWLDEHDICTQTQTETVPFGIFEQHKKRTADFKSRIECPEQDRAFQPFADTLHTY